MQFIVRGTKYELDQERLTFGEARAIERVTGVTFDKLAGDIMSTQALVWVAMKRAEPTLKFSDLDDLTFGEFEMLEDPPEVEADPTIPPPGKYEAALQVEVDHAEPPDDPSTATPGVTCS